VLYLRSRRPTLIGFTLLSLALVAATATHAHAASRRSHAQAPGAWCGGVLWRQETFSDPGRFKVKVNPMTTSIPDIAALAPPRRITPTRSTAFQRQVWHLRAVVDRYRIASNGEIVLILFNIDSGRYMNAYMPNPSCLTPKTRQRGAILAARKEFMSHCPAVTVPWQLLGITADISGVGFWNPAHNTRGALPNGAELRPITNFAIDFGCGVS